MLQYKKGKIASHIRIIYIDFNLQHVASKNIVNQASKNIVNKGSYQFAPTCTMFLQYLFYNTAGHELLTFDDKVHVHIFCSLCL